MAPRDGAAPQPGQPGGTHNTDALNVKRHDIPLPHVRGAAYDPSGARHGLLVVVPDCCYCGRAHAHRALGVRVAGCRQGGYLVTGGAV